MVESKNFEPSSPTEDDGQANAISGDRLIGRPGSLLCLVLVVFSALYFIKHATQFYIDLDFSSYDMGNSPLTDFFVFYSSARFLWDGGATWDLYNSGALKAFQVSLGASENGYYPFNYPPTYLFLIWPLGGLSYPIALIVWQFLSMTLLVLCLKIAGLRHFEIFAACVAPVTLLNFTGGQNGAITSALLIAGLALLARKEYIAGVLFGILTFKPHLGLLVPVACLAEGRWRAIIAAICVTIAIVCASILVFSSASWAAYFNFLDQFQDRIGSETGGRFLQYSATVLMAEQMMGLPKAFSQAVQIVVTVGVGLVVFRAYRRTDHVTLRLVLLLVGVSLATPFGFLYDLPFMAVAAILMARLGLQSGFLRFEIPCLVAVWLSPLASLASAQWGFPLAPWIHLIFFGIVLVRLNHVRQQVSQPQVAHN